MICPECKSRTRIIDSRPTNKDVRRRRKCRECGHRFSTIEIRFDEIEAQLEKFKQIGKELRKLRLLKGRLGKLET